MKLFILKWALRFILYPITVLVLLVVVPFEAIYFRSIGRAWESAIAGLLMIKLVIYAATKDIDAALTKEGGE